MSDVAGVVGVLAGLDCSLLSRDQVKVSLGELARVQSWHDGVHARLTRRLGELAETDGAILPAADVAACSRSSRQGAEQAVRRAEVLSDVPEMEQALDAGQVSAAHVDALGRAVRRLTPDRRAGLTCQGDRLALIAANSTPEQFERAVQHEISRLDRQEGCDRLERQRRASRLRSWTDRDSGMVCIRGEFDPESGLRLLARIDQATETLFHRAVPDSCPTGDSKQDHLRALALLHLINRNTADPGDGGDIERLDHSCEIIVTMTLEQFVGDTDTATTVDSGFDIDLPIQTYRRWACTAGIIPVVLNSDRVVLDQGRSTRLATRNQRRALRAMYTTCAIPGCNVTSRLCQPHHIRYWRNGGPTNLDNLVPLCSTHHHHVHEGGWTIDIDPDRSLTITYPNGTRQRAGPPQTQWAS